MKKNNKGFTLIELLAVVVILLAVSVIAISSISAAIERNKKKQNATKIAVIETYAKLYYDEHKNSITGNKISIYDLDLSDSEIVDADGDIICGYVLITFDGNDNPTKFEFNKDDAEIYCPTGTTPN